MCSGDSELVSGGKLFSRMVYLWMLFLFLFLSPLLHDVIGPKGLTYRTAYTPGILNNLVYILSYKPVLYKSIWAFNAAGIILCFFNLGIGKRAFSRKFWVLNTAINVLPKVIVWITGIILFSSTYFLFNAGVYLATNWLFWLIFYTPNPDSDWRIALNNWAVLAARIQFLIVYVGYILFLSKGQVEWLHSKLGLFSFKKVRK